MYLDETIKVGKVPKNTQMMMDLLDEYYWEGEDIYFMARLDELEAYAKQDCLDLKITEKQLEAIFKRYGLM